MQVTLSSWARSALQDGWSPMDYLGYFGLRHQFSSLLIDLATWCTCRAYGYSRYHHDSRNQVMKDYYVKFSKCMNFSLNVFNNER